MKCDNKILLLNQHVCECCDLLRTEYRGLGIKCDALLNDLQMDCCTLGINYAFIKSQFKDLSIEVSIFNISKLTVV